MNYIYVHQEGKVFLARKVVGHENQFIVIARLNPEAHPKDKEELEKLAKKLDL